MIIHFTKPALKQISKLPQEIKEKTRKQFKRLIKNANHPSIRFKKMSGTARYEGRIDYHYRFSGKFMKNEFFVTAIGPHDEGLGKK